MGTLFKKKGSKQWQMGVTANGRQVCKSAHTTNKSRAKKLLAQWETEVFEGRYRLIKSNAPVFGDYADQYLLTVPNIKTRLRYSSSINNLKTRFGKLRLPLIGPDLIEEFKDARLAEKVAPATINRDLAVLRRMLKIAERKRLIARTPFVEVEFFEERSMRRKPHIVTYEEEEKIMAVACPYIKALVVLILETGLRSHREALVLRWEDIDFATNTIRVRESKTAAGIRSVPLSTRCKAELLMWRDHVGPEFSPWVFPKMQNPQRHLSQIRRSWENALKLAGIPHFWLYNLRHSFCSRLSAAGVSDLFVAQLIGHSSPSIVQTYAKAIDEHKRDAIRKLESLRPQTQHARLPSASPSRPN